MALPQYNTIKVRVTVFVYASYICKSRNLALAYPSRLAETEVVLELQTETYAPQNMIQYCHYRVRMGTILLHICVSGHDIFLYGLVPS